MSSEQIRKEAATLARLARISVPAEREDALQMGLAGAEAAAKAISAHDFGPTEPAFRFRPPAPR